MYFQMNYFNFFSGPRLKFLVSRGTGDSAHSCKRNTWLAKMFIFRFLQHYIKTIFIILLLTLEQADSCPNSLALMLNYNLFPFFLITSG